jgi:DNA-binding SARP family transcriptional activator/predicted ATPase
MDDLGAVEQYRSPVRLYLLGGFHAERDGQSLPENAWSRRSAKVLVKLLAATPAHRLHRDQIVDLLWPDLPPASAANAFRKALHLARRALDPVLPPRGESAHLRLHDDIVALVPELVWVDADCFQASAEAALSDGDLGAIERALALYEGDLLPEDRYEHWTEARRTALADLRYTLLLELATGEEGRSNFAAATEHLRQALELDPSREEVHRQLMRLYALDGRRHHALRQYRMCCEALQRELDADPEPTTVALYQAVLAGRVGPSIRPDGRSRTPMPLPVSAHRLSADPLVGREREFALLISALNQAATGSGGAVLVGGEAGVGKSRLVAEVARAAHERGALVLWGACYEQEGRLPYGPLVEALDGAIAGRLSEAHDRFVAAYPELVGFLPALHRATDPTSATVRPDANRTRLFAAVVRLLAELSGNRPLVLTLDDLHAADPASLQLLHHVARMARERHWLILGTLRDEDVSVGSDLQRFCAAAVREGLCHRVDLGRLPRDGCDRLVETLLANGCASPDLHDLLYARSLGNPLFLVELLRAMKERGDLACLDGRWTIAPTADAGVPKQIRALIVARVDHRGDDVRRALALAATAGEVCSFRLLRDAGELPEPQLLDALDCALGAQLLEERGGGYAFRHPLVRATLYERLSPPRRALLHAALARAIEASPERVPDDQPNLTEALAYHWAAAGEPARAVPYLIQAADQAAQVYANTDAIARLCRALALLDEQPLAQPEVFAHRAPICERLGDLHALIGENELARDRYLEAAAAPGATSAAGARLCRKAAQQALFAGQLDRAELLLTEVETHLKTSERRERSGSEQIRLVIARAQLHFLAARFEAALSTAEKALRLAETAGSRLDIAQACEMIAMACLPLGHWRRGLEFERRHAALADPTQALRDVADVHICLSEYHLYAEQPAAAARAILRTLADAQRAGAPRSLALCHYYLGTMAYMRGRFPEAIEHLNDAVALYLRLGSRSGEGVALMVRGLAKTALGQHPEGLADLERGVAAAEQGTLRSHGLIRLYAATGLHYLEDNDPIAARRQAELGLALADEPSTCICYAAIHPVAAAAFAMTGDIPRAIDLGNRAITQARTIGSPFFLCKSFQANAIVGACRGAWDAAFSAFEAAQDLAAMHDLPYELARTLQFRAVVHQQRAAPGDLEAASDLTARAGAMLRELGVSVTV